MTPVTERIRQSLVSLHMARALETLDQVLSRLEKGEMTAIEAIDALLAEELTLREGRRIGVGLRTARLTPIKTLESFDFSFQPSLDRHRIMALAQLEFINRAEVLHFLGPPGTGKSHLATALGVAAVKVGRSAYRCTLAELIDTLAQAEREGRLPEKIRFYARASLLIVDEIGYLPISSGGANLFFQLVNARYEQLEQCLSELLDGLEGLNPEQVFLECADEPLRAAIAFRCPDEGRGGRNTEPADLTLEVTAGRVRAQGRACLTLTADLASPDGPGAAARVALDAWATIDILVNSAGTARIATATELDHPVGADQVFMPMPEGRTGSPATQDS